MLFSLLDESKGNTYKGLYPKTVFTVWSKKNKHVSESSVGGGGGGYSAPFSLARLSSGEYT